MHNWLSILEGGGEIGAVFFDLRKAFDSIPHEALLDKLKRTGLSNPILSWITDYLTCREQKVVVNGKESQAHTRVVRSTAGVSSGPITLSNIYWRSGSQLPLLDGGQVVLYADDLLLFHPIQSQEDYHQLQSDIVMIEDWVYSNYLTLTWPSVNIWLCRRRGAHLPL